MFSLQLTCKVEEREGYRGCAKQGIKPVKHTAMPRQDITGIFNPEKSFKPGFCQVADGTKYQDNKAKHNPLV